MVIASTRRTRIIALVVGLVLAVGAGVGIAALTGPRPSPTPIAATRAATSGPTPSESVSSPAVGSSPTTPSGRPVSTATPVTPAATSTAAATPSPAAVLAATRGPVQECPSEAEVLRAAMAQPSFVKDRMVVTVGPRCSAGWAAAIVGPPNADTHRIVLRRGASGFAVVVYQDAKAACPSSIAAMPAALRTAVAC
jgi:hypothetical protein